MEFRKKLIPISIIIILAISVDAQHILPVGIREATVEDITNILYAISAAFGTLLLIFHGFKWMTSDTLDDRNEAKKGIIYTLLGLSIIVIALALVDFFYSAPVGY